MGGWAMGRVAWARAARWTRGEGWPGWVGRQRGSVGIEMHG